MDVSDIMCYPDCTGCPYSAICGNDDEFNDPYIFDDDL